MDQKHRIKDWGIEMCIIDIYKKPNYWCADIQPQEEWGYDKNEYKLRVKGVEPNSKLTIDLKQEAESACIEQEPENKTSQSELNKPEVNVTLVKDELNQTQIVDIKNSSWTSEKIGPNPETLVTDELIETLVSNKSEKAPVIPEQKLNSTIAMKIPITTLEIMENNNMTTPALKVEIITINDTVIITTITPKENVVSTKAITIEEDDRLATRSNKTTRAIKKDDQLSTKTNNTIRAIKQDIADLYERKVKVTTVDRLYNQAKENSWYKWVEFTGNQIDVDNCYLCSKNRQRALYVVNYDHDWEECRTSKTQIQGTEEEVVEQLAQLNTLRATVSIFSLYYIFENQYHHKLCPLRCLMFLGAKRFAKYLEKQWKEWPVESIMEKCIKWTYL